MEVVSLASKLIPRPEVVACDIAVPLPRGDIESVGSRDAWAGIDRIVLRSERVRNYSLLSHYLIPMTAIDFPRLVSLDASHCDLNEGAVRIFAERLLAPNLRELSLSYNQILDPSFRHLAKAVFAPTLEVLDLSGNPLSRPSLSTLTRDRFPSLRRVVLHECRIVPEVLERLRAQLPGVSVVCDPGNA